MTETSSTSTPQEEPKQIASTPSNLKLIKWEGESYAGINALEGKSIICFFEPGKPITGFEGDQGMRKTSALNCIKALLGGDEVENAISQQDGTKKASMELVIGGATYVTKITKTEFSLTELKPLPGGGVANSKIASPKTVLKNLIGPLGTDPMFLKGLDGSAQIEWLQKMFTLSPEMLTARKDLEAKYKLEYEARTNVNRDMKATKAVLDNSQYYEFDKKAVAFISKPNYGMAKVKFSKDITVIEQQLKKNLDDATARRDMKKEIEACIPQREAKISENNISITDDESTIRQLEDRIKMIKDAIVVKQEQVKHFQSEIAQCQEKLLEYSDVDEKFNAANQAYIDHGDYKLYKKQFQDDEAAFSSFEQKRLESAALSKKLVDIESSQLKFAQSITPDIEGMEVCIRSQVNPMQAALEYKEANPDATEDDFKTYLQDVTLKASREGIYYQGHSIAQLSESELFDLWIRLCKSLKINVVFIENISSLGTSAINAINSFADAGGLIFYSAMERGKSELKITFLDQIK